MLLPDSFYELSQAHAKAQVETKQGNASNGNKNESSLKKLAHGENQLKKKEQDLIRSPFKNLVRYGTTEDAVIDDAASWKEVEDTMESMKRIHKALTEGAKLKDVFGFSAEMYEDKKMIKSKDDLKIFIEEINKMDAILRVKVSEEKRAKLSRIQVQEESRNLLMELRCPKTSTGIKNNFEEYVKLLNAFEKIECCGSSSFCKTNEGDGVGASGDDVKIENRKENPILQDQKTNNLKFIERNIQLAKCGRGTLSLTEEEKSRIESLLADSEASDVKSVNKDSVDAGSSMASKDCETKDYGIDDDIKITLNQIDKNLEMLTEVRKSKDFQAKINSMEKKDDKKRVSEESEKGKEKKNRSRLKKINELLNSINSISAEEISPLTEEEMERLIRDSKQILSQEKYSGSEEAQCPHELITELVVNAKLLMPKFKFRFRES